MKKILIPGAVLALLSASAVQAGQAPFKVPFKYGLGKSLFEQNCAACHGQYGQGSDKGPPFMSPIYRPGHHGDDAFYRAPMNGAKAHHWKFGDMPPVKGITRRKLSKIIPYIRWIQRQNGIQ